MAKTEGGLFAHNFEQEYGESTNRCTLCGLTEDRVLPGDCPGAALEDFATKKVELAFALEQLETAEKRAREAIRFFAKSTGQVGTVIEVKGARAKVFRAKKPRVSWPNDKLEGYALVHPEILALREETWPEDTVRIYVD